MLVHCMNYQLVKMLDTHVLTRQHNSIDFTYRKQRTETNNAASLTVHRSHLTSVHSFNIRFSVHKSKKRKKN